MEASVNGNSATATPVAPSIPRTAPAPTPAAPTAPPAAPAVATSPAPAARPAKRPVNWSMIVRVGLVIGLVVLLVGYALKVTYESVIKGGVVAAGDFYKVDLKQMSNFEMDQTLGGIADVPERYRQLDGKRVILEGEVAPAGTMTDNIKSFSLCYSVAKCCYGGPPKVQHFVTCSAPNGRPMPNYEGAGMIRVYGTLHVKVVKNDGGGISSIFQMDVERIEPVS